MGPGGGRVFVRRLEIQGFKSFADRVVLEFGPGVTGIVGPNGAGKSNVTDAVRWVLGEQNPRLLRSSRMEDVIFNGSATRKPLGFAEVVLTLDNQDGRFGVDFTEISLTRRLFRSGESEYLVNGVPARLKDIADLLAGTGLGREGYSLIGQGRIDEILAATPESRRAVFDEACGIGIHRGRKREALARLDEIAARLERVSDVTAELKAQLAPLEQQAEVARTFVAYRDELERLELWLESRALVEIRSKTAAARARLDELDRKAAALKDRRDRLTERARVLRSAETELAELMERKREEAAASEAALRRLSDQVADLDRKLADIRREAELFEAERGRVKERLERTEARLAEVEADRAVQAERRAEIVADLEELARREASAKGEVSRLKAAEREAGRGLEQILGDVRDRRYRLRTAEAELARLTDERARLARQAEAARRELAEVERELAQSSSRLSGLESQAAACSRALQDCETREADLVRRLEELGRRMDEERTVVMGLDSRRVELEAALAASETGARSALAAVAAARDGPSPGSGPWTDGFVGVLGEVLEFDPVHGPAVQAALGPLVGAIVVRTEADLRRTLSHLRKERLGPAAVLALDLVDRRLAGGGSRRRGTAAPGRSSDQGAGLTLLAGLVRCPEVFRPVVDLLLGDTAFTRDYEAARDLVAGGAARRAVTPDGLLVRPGGIVSFPGQQGPGRGDLSLAALRELREVRRAAEAARGRLESLAAERREAEKALAEARTERTRLAQSHRTLSGDIAALSARVKQLDTRRSALAERLTGAALAEPEIQRRLAALAKEKVEHEQAIEELGRREAQARSGLGDLENALAAAEEALAETLNRLGEAKVEAATLAEKERAAAEEVERLGREIERLRAEAERLEERLAELGQKTRQFSEEVQPLRERLTAVSSSGARPSEQDLETWRTRQKELAAELQAVEKELDEVAAALDESSQRRQREQTRLARLEAEEEMTLRRLRRDWGDDWEARVQPPPPTAALRDEETVRARLTELRRAIGELGVVNIGAIEEYRRLSERIDFLARQAADLAEAREGLVRLVAEIDRTMAAKFEEGFLAVRRLFREKVPELFGGGRGDLILTDRGNLLDSGIEVLVEPPAKKLQSLALLSAGERALSALALLLAFLEVRPSPFVILDEIDAPLDDANVARFCSAVAGLVSRSSTQFIIVTHNKTTMELAEGLYGVTMGEDGVSRLVSVKLEDREAFRRRVMEEAD